MAPLKSPHEEFDWTDFYLFTGGWEFTGLSCQVDQIFQNGLQVGHLPQHVDLVVLHAWNGEREVETERERVDVRTRRRH